MHIAGLSCDNAALSSEGAKESGVEFILETPPDEQRKGFKRGLFSPYGLLGTNLLSASRSFWLLCFS